MTTTIREYDLIVIGGGCAGLSLARSLIQKGSQLRVLIVESRSIYFDDRTWCFWGRADHPLRNLEEKSWDAWQFSVLGAAPHLHRPRNDLAYRCIRSGTFYENAQKEIERCPNVSLRLSVNVDACWRDSETVTVATDEGDFYSRWVVDTRPSPIVSNEPRFGQYFCGAEIEAERDIFDEHVAQIMMDMQHDDHGFRFTYLLPFSKRRALIEETRFCNAVSQDQLEQDLSQAIAGRLKGVAFCERRREEGFIPMGISRRSASEDAFIFNAGVAAGAVRPSTGYAFSRIQNWALSCASALSQGAGPLSHAADPAWIRWIDQLFLKVIQDSRNDVPEIFSCLARGMQPDHFVRFLSDNVMVSDFVRAIHALPKKPFLAGLAVLPEFKWLKR
ncbi:lycopene cyclase family protein [Arenicellales bacterium IMCC57338]